MSITVFVLKYILIFCFLGKPVMIITEYMENGSLDTFLKVGQMGTGCLRGGLSGMHGEGNKGLLGHRAGKY